MGVKRIFQWCGKPVMEKKTTTNYCSPQCPQRGYKIPDEGAQNGTQGNPGNA